MSEILKFVEILRFVIVDSDNNEGDHEYTSREEAIEDAGKQDSAVIMRTYIYDDSELIWTPNGDDIWPVPEEDRG